MQDRGIEELARVAARAADAIVREEPLDASVPAFLLRHYLAADADGLRGALGLALTRALTLAAAETTVAGRAAWLSLLVDASAVTDDERMRPAVAELVAALRAGWRTHTSIGEASASVEACLLASALVDPDPLVQDAIDELERVVGGSYQPGEGLVTGRDGVRASFADHVRGASALLTAFEVTGRLPYSMLAEELMLIAVRDAPGDAGIAIQCDAARVWCRLAALHDDPAYRGAAVIAAGADYRADVSRILAALSARAQAGSPSDAAAYGLALLDLLK